MSLASRNLLENKPIKLSARIGKHVLGSEFLEKNRRPVKRRIGPVEGLSAREERRALVGPERAEQISAVLAL
jgi:hypothetical protein